MQKLILVLLSILANDKIKIKHALQFFKLKLANGRILKMFTQCISLSSNNLWISFLLFNTFIKNIQKTVYIVHILHKKECAFTTCKHTYKVYLLNHLIIYTLHMNGITILCIVYTKVKSYILNCNFKIARSLSLLPINL